MAQTPLKDMSYKGYENHSEEFGLMHDEWVKDRIYLQRQIEKCVTKDEWMEFLNFQNQSSVCIKTFNSCINTLASKLDAANDAIKALADKLDAEDVTNLDSDYRTTVDAEIK